MIKRDKKGRFVKGSHNPSVEFKVGHKLRLGMKHTKEFCKRRKSEGNPGWKGDLATISSLHAWIKRNWGTPRYCEKCKSHSKTMYDWASINHSYTRERKDWMRLCRGCHMKYDYYNGFRRISENKNKKV